MDRIFEKWEGAVADAALRCNQRCPSGDTACLVRCKDDFHADLTKPRDAARAVCKQKCDTAASDEWFTAFHWMATEKRRAECTSVCYLRHPFVDK